VGRPLVALKLDAAAPDARPRVPWSNNHNEARPLAAADPARELPRTPSIRRIVRCPGRPHGSLATQPPPRCALRLYFPPIRANRRALTPLPT
jgi:hypothetical protein